MADEPAETNITDTPGDGTTVTTLVGTHDRGSRDWNTRVGEGDPFGPEGPPAAPATGATAGSPGTWSPAGSLPPATPASMVGITANPTAAWTTGQYMQTALAGAAGQTYWDGDSWNPGVAP